jgi:tripartite-type tricarboxylate transporter receptor subunit TctC
MAHTTHRTNRRTFLGATALGLTWPAVGQEPPWPARPITLVVPFPPGGITDVNARLVAQSLTQTLGQPVVVENRAGASGNIGSAVVAKAKPDGYTFVVSGVGTHAANVGLFPSMPYDPLKDFTHITNLSSSPNAIAVHPSLPVKTLAELLALLRQNPGQFDYASPGNGSSGHFAFELLKQKANVQAQHIAYKGAAPALADVIGGQVPILVMVADTLPQHVKAGKLRLLATTGDQRSPLFPDTPTVAESGFPQFRAISWTGISGPAGLPETLVRKVHAEVLKAFQTPSVRDKFQQSGNALGGLSPADFTQFVRGEIAQWTAVARAANIQPD